MNVFGQPLRCECRWKIDDLATKVLAKERKLLKAILKVKPSTANDIFAELNRIDELIKIKCIQFKFYR